MLTSVCTGLLESNGTMGLLDGIAATNRKEPRPGGGKPARQGADRSPRPHRTACRISRARVVDQGRIVTAGRHLSGMEMGFQPAAPGRLRGGLHLRGGAGDGVQRRPTRSTATDVES